MIPFATYWICPKCGEKHPSGWSAGKPKFVPYQGLVSIEEHLRWTCVRCGYIELMACKDYDGDPATE